MQLVAHMAARASVIAVDGYTRSLGALTRVQVIVAEAKDFS
jgi:ribosomal protein S28E/S33